MRGEILLSCCGFETSYARFDCKFVLWPSYSKVFSIVRLLTVILFKVFFFFFCQNKKSHYTETRNNFCSRNSQTVQSPFMTS